MPPRETPVITFPRVMLRGLRNGQASADAAIVAAGRTGGLRSDASGFSMRRPLSGPLSGERVAFNELRRDLGARAAACGVAEAGLSLPSPGLSPVHTERAIEAIGSDSTDAPAGSWTTDHSEGTVWYTAGTALSGNHLSKFVITVAGHPALTIQA